MMVVNDERADMFKEWL